MNWVPNMYGLNRTVGWTRRSLDTAGGGGGGGMCPDLVPRHVFAVLLSPDWHRGKERRGGGGLGRGLGPHNGSRKEVQHRA